MPRFLYNGAMKRLPFVLCGLFVASCAGTPDREAPAGPTNDLLIIGYDREPDTMNRFSTHILEDIHACIIEGLTVPDENMEAVPLLAQVVPSPENGMVQIREDGGMDVTWKLRPNIRWHDGEPLTSEDIRFTVDAIHSPDWNPESTDGFDRIESVEVVDELTVRLHYREVYAAYENQFFRGLLPRHLLEGRDIETAVDYNRNPLGTGPYRVKEWRTGEYILLERVPDYWRGSEYPHIRQIMFRFLSNENTRIQALRAGEANLVGPLPWDRVPEVEQIDGIRLARTPANSYEHLMLNQSQVEAFKDVRVRRAIGYAIDRETIVQAILHGLTPVVDTPIQPVSWAHNPDAESPPYDPDRARELLAEAGYADGLAFTIMTLSGNVVRERVALAIQSQLREVGIDVSIQLFDSATLGSMWFGGEFDTFLSSWTMPPDPEITLFFASDRSPPRGRNVNFYTNPELDPILYESDRTIDRERRRELLFEAQMILAEDLPEIFLYNRTFVNAIPANLENFKGNPTNAGIYWNVHEWRLN